MTETAKLKPKPDFTSVTTAGKSTIGHLTEAIKTDDTAALLTAIQQWMPPVVELVTDIIFQKAKLWEKISKTPELAHLRDLDYSGLFHQHPKQLIPSRSNTPIDLFPSVHSSLVSIEAGQIAMTEKLNTVLAVNPMEKELDKLRKQIQTPAYFVNKYGDQVRDFGM